ncbi:RNA polymerase sigma factor [Mucilaginibacter myungsuensis]|uniref:Sigma-70 family RNA polymerase sigma factor n=1 Tax=Mucilaginibacter myungsuensis TaxID=649104 RepID=A0A929PUN3_9SPHI|nr:sigma-70 family RNA polymerase sigma factor [Mucilaginibacter myungsuensis]MBE9660948.1 sigma-70 family RNA polymerase sigma factor [Mucilaginibacter myungsuensis]MDN3600994.1 sigma-70 family RNA polymerase sigma factor [Mucilaginibacter myungsuensis]
MNNNVPTDSEVILGILNNSDAVLKKLYLAYYPMVLQLIINNSGTADDAKDIYQEAIIVLYNKVKGGEFELSSKLKTFIYSVCRRLWLKRLTQMSRYGGDIRDFEQFLPVEDDMEVHADRDIQFHKMESSLGLLGEPCKSIIEDFYIHDRSMQEICEKFGYTNADNAKTQKYKCLQRLKKLFFQQK